MRTTNTLWGGPSAISPPLGHALCFMVKTWARHKATETVLDNGWRLAAVGGWRLVAVGSWWLVVGGGWGRLVFGSWWWLVVGSWWSLEAVLQGCP